jgi:DNA-binding NarL/FixJ family response regulator
MQSVAGAWTPESRKSGSEGRIRLLLADDHHTMLERLRRLLEADHDIVGAVADADQIVTAVVELAPDILLLDVSMPAQSGFVIARRLREGLSPVKILFVTQHSEPAYVEEAKRVGAAGYVLKRRVASEMKIALQAISQGGVFYSPELAA